MIPIGFSKRMKEILKDEYDSFIHCLTDEEAVKAIRINTLKTGVEALRNSSYPYLTPLPYADDGFILNNPEGIGNSPEHHSGMIYVQDPGAMATLNCLEVKEGWHVLDMCAAPGGKSGQAAAKIGDGGFLLSNEFVPKRAKITVSNFERLGIKCAVVTSLDTKELPKLYSSFFDLIIADVPCSGEGMFRKNSVAIDQWSEENVKASAERQKEILENASTMAKPGGYIIYSTCTYSIEENEMVIDDFLKKHPEYRLVKCKDSLVKATSDGISFAGAYTENLHYARRFYPHVSKGEGQFCALLQRDEKLDKKPTILYKEKVLSPTKDEISAINQFFKENLEKTPSGRIIKHGDNLIIVNHSIPIPSFSVFSAGVLLGKVNKGLIFPEHQFFSAYGKLFKRQENLTRGDVRVNKYLRGEEISQEISLGSGWCAVMFEGAALGGGKASNSIIKNHYPKGLRIKA